MHPISSVSCAASAARGTLVGSRTTSTPARTAARTAGSRPCGPGFVSTTRRPASHSASSEGTGQRGPASRIPRSATDTCRSPAPSRTAMHVAVVVPAPAPATTPTPTSSSRAARSRPRRSSPRAVCNRADVPRRPSASATLRATPPSDENTRPGEDVRRTRSAPGAGRAVMSTIDPPRTSTSGAARSVAAPRAAWRATAISAPTSAFRFTSATFAARLAPPVSSATLAST
mmetsp:Transcript_32006/g.63407  ORF Transcript_32006/g.63407 Transcript_32006/m.63407 type:complete len:230 (-) Transcript_32006:296-985(-)